MERVKIGMMKLEGMTLITERRNELLTITPKELFEIRRKTEIHPVDQGMYKLGEKEGSPGKMESYVLFS